jgi:glucokinase
MDYFIGIDLGGTKTKTILADAALEVLDEVTIPTDMTSEETIINGLLQTISRVKGAQAVRAIGIATPGQLDRERGIAIQAPSMGWHDVPLVARVAGHFGIPAFIENDINVAALGEFTLQKAHGASAVYINVGTGIGAGVIMDGRLYVGQNGYAGEFGHLTMVPGGPLCNCGNRGCLEAIAAGPAIAARAAQVAMTRTDSALHPKALEGTLTAKDVAVAAEQGDATAVAILSDTGNYLGRAVADLAALFDPGTVIFGGSVVLNSPYIWDAMLQEAQSHLFPIIFAKTQFIKARLGSRSGAIGAVILAQQRSVPA